MAPETESSSPVALVTGAGTGVGRATALALAEQGYRVAAVGRRRQLLEALAEKEPRVHPIVASLHSSEGCEGAVAETVHSLGPPLVVVHSAGGGTHRPVWDLAYESWRETMALNLDAAFQLSRLTSQAMCDAGFGRIVFVSSTASTVGAATMAAYCAAKAGVDGLMRAVACDVAPYGVTCNSVLPTWIKDTEMSSQGAEREAHRRGIAVEDVWAERNAAAPAGRVVTATEVAAVIAFLTSPAASGVNGASIDVTLGSVW